MFGKVEKIVKKVSKPIIAEMLPNFIKSEKMKKMIRDEIKQEVAKAAKRKPWKK